MKQRPGHYQKRPAWYEPHGNIRTDCYVLLAALLNGSPSDDVIKLVRDLHWDENLPESLHGALAALKRTGRNCEVETIAAEYQRLFVGLGSGEIVPYASWYREKIIQSTPLAAIRSDLKQLGIIRKEDVFEAEDHAGVLCEIMVLLSMPDTDIPENVQAVFFEEHIFSWMPQFFEDLQKVNDAAFFRALGRLGRCFLEGENYYLQYARQEADETTAASAMSGTKYAKKFDAKKR